MLKPSGSFAAAVWEAGPTARPLASLASDVAREVFDPAPGRATEPSPPGDTLESQMRRAGFSDVRVEDVPLSLEFASTEDCIQYLVDVSPTFAALLADKPLGLQAQYRHRLAERLQPYVQTEGRIRVPNVTLCAAGRR